MSASVNVHASTARSILTLGPNLSDNKPATGAKKKMQKIAKDPSLIATGKKISSSLRHEEVWLIDMRTMIF